MTVDDFNAGINLLIANYRQEFEPLMLTELKEIFKKKYSGVQWLEICRYIKKTRKDFIPTEACFWEAASVLGLGRRPAADLGATDQARPVLTATEVLKALEGAGFDALAAKVRERRRQ